MSKVLVTGANGFLGKAVCEALANGHHDVIPLNGKREFDLTDKKQVFHALTSTQPEKVIHLAATCGGIGINQKQPGKFLYDNLAMGMNLIEGCRQYGTEKFVMVGTVCAYPKFTPVPFKESDLWNGYPEETNAPYGIAKKTLMEMLIAYKNQYGFNSCNLIPVNMYGEWDNFDPRSSHVIPALILKIAKAMDTMVDPEIKIWGDGTASREFLYASDCANAIVKAMEVETSPDPINLGTGQEISISDLVNKIAQIMSYKGLISFDNSKPNGQPRRCLDVSLAKERLGWQAKTPLDLGLVHTIEWFYAHKGRLSDYYDYI